MFEKNRKKEKLLCSTDTVKQIDKIHKSSIKKQLMAEGKDRKASINKKTVCRTKKISSLFASALLPLQEYILSFQEAEPSIHKLFG